MHKGVGVLISNKERNKFFIQQKDESYPIDKWKLSYSTWGGKIEEQERPLEALMRELEEELNVADIEYSINFFKLGVFYIENDRNFEYHLYEGVTENAFFEKLSGITVNEGYGKIVLKSELLKLNWIWGLNSAIEYYLAQNF